VPVSSGGLKTMAQLGEFVFVGSGDGSLKKVKSSLTDHETKLTQLFLAVDGP